MRQWLKKQGWKETTDPKKWEELDLLLGPRSQWGKGNAQRQIDDDFRISGRVFFGMPYWKEGNNLYVIRIWAFWVPELGKRLPNSQALTDLLKEYMQDIFPKAQASSIILGKDILSKGGDER